MEKGLKATMGFAPTERRYLRKVASEHCNTETKDGVNPFSENFQGALWERTELAHITLSHSLARTFKFKHLILATCFTISRVSSCSRGSLDWLLGRVFYLDVRKRVAKHWKRLPREGWSPHAQSYLGDVWMWGHSLAMGLSSSA